MELTRQQALALHRQMWGDMLKELGERGKGDEHFIIDARAKFKRKWVEEHFPGERVNNDCFLCEYAHKTFWNSVNYYPDQMCGYCPIDWGETYWSGTEYMCEHGTTQWCFTPISEILALPEREVNT